MKEATINFWINFSYSNWKLICCNKWRPGTIRITLHGKQLLEHNSMNDVTNKLFQCIYLLMEKLLGTYFQVQLLALSGCMVQKIYFNIFNITDTNQDYLPVLPVPTSLSLSVLYNISNSIFHLARLVKTNKHLSNTAFSLIPSQHWSQLRLKKHVLPHLVRRNL